MKRLMRIHRYLSCFVAPAMLFFAISGAWQAFRYHENRKDGTYTAPAVLKTLSALHKADSLHGQVGTLFRLGQLGLAALFVTTAVIGLIMGFRLARPAWLVWAWVAAGVVLPMLLALLAHSG